MTTACDLLTKMDEEILAKPGNWRQGAYGVSDGPKCLVGALNFAASGYTALSLSPAAESYEAFCNARGALVSLVKSEGTEGIVQFNDDPGTTFEDIKALLAQARKAVC